MPRRKSGYCLRCGEFIGAGGADWASGTGGVSVPNNARGEMPYGVCGNCLLTPPPWQKIYFYGAYQGLLRESISRLKFEQALHLALPLGNLLAAHPDLCALREPKQNFGCLHTPEAEFGAPEALHVSKSELPTQYSCIVPVPLHKKRLRERGFNQSALLAVPLAKALNLPIKQKLLERSRDTAHQTGLSREMRRRNLQAAFAVKVEVSGLRILLFDDVLTTGATLSAAASALLRAGAAGVDVAVLARTPAHHTGA